MNRFFLLFGLFLLIGFSVEAQRIGNQRTEVGLMLGGSNYQGDLSPPSGLPVDIDETNFALGGIFRYYFTPRLNFKANVYYGTISGDDRNFQERVGRNLSFESHVLEFSGQVEFNILPFISGSRTNRFAPYVFTGISVFNFNPQAEDIDGNMVELQPLGTEGQGTPSGTNPYSLTQIAIPMGVGFKYAFRNGWNLGFEFGSRRTFTDYLDDIGTNYAPDGSQLSPKARQMSYRQPGYTGGDDTIYPDGRQRGGDSVDWYIFSGITITKTLFRNVCGAF